MKRWLTVTVLAPLLVVACGKGDDRSALETVRLAADTTAADTFGFSMRMSFPGVPEPVEAEGVFDGDERLAEMSFDMSRFGMKELGEVRAVMSFVDGAVIYMNTPELFADAPPEFDDYEWMSIDMEEMLRQSGTDVDMNDLLQASNDPTTGLEQLRGTTAVVEVGSEEVRGDDTTHYDVTIDLDKALAEMPAEIRDSMKSIYDVYEERTVTVDVWIDDDGRVRRVESVEDLTDLDLPPNAAMPATGKMTMRFEFFDFGTDADIEIPSDDDVVDLLDLMERTGS